MTLIRALSELSEHVPSAPTAREQLHRLEVLARRELAVLQRSAAADGAPSAATSAWTLLAWDLGLDPATLEHGER